jgi:hypothetical protein
LYNIIIKERIERLGYVAKRLIWEIPSNAIHPSPYKEIGEIIQNSDRVYLPRLWNKVPLV